MLEILRGENGPLQLPQRCASVVVCYLQCVVCTVYCDI